MFRKFLFLFAAVLSHVNVLAQEVLPVKHRVFYHYAGVQVNELIRQLINLNNNSTPVDNPYLLTYSIQSARYRLGLRAGIGYRYQKITDELSPANHQSKISDWFYRVGIERKFNISKKFEGSCSLDFTADYQMDKTFTFSVIDSGTQTDSSATVAVSKTTSTGGGLQLNIGYKITDRLLLSTELTCYYSKSKQKQNVMVSEVITNNSNHSFDTATLTSSNQASGESNFTLTAPVALFLILKF